MRHSMGSTHDNDAFQFDVAFEDQSPFNTKNEEEWNQLIRKALIVINDFVELKGELSISFISNNRIQKLNKKYRKKDAPTNVLSFPQETQGVLGDVVLSMDKIYEESVKQDKKPLYHFLHLLVHGVLHILGFDHNTEEEREKMEDLEIKILYKLGVKNPYE